MKILYIITQADGGGAQKYTLALARAFGGELAAGTEENQMFTEARSLEINTHSLKYLKRGINPIMDVLALVELVNLIKKVRPDIVHLNSSKAGFTGSIAGKLARRKVVFTAHGFIFNEPLPFILRKFYLYLEKFASLFRDRIIAVSRADAGLANKHRLLPPQKIAVIHNGLAPIVFLPREQAKKELGLNEAKFVFGTIANFYKTKGLDLLVEAVAQLPQEALARSEFVFIGEGKERKLLESKISGFGLKNVRLMGKIPEAARYLKAFDVFILPSRKEGFPYALLEAMQAGLPIMATNVGGNAEVLGEAGILLQPEAPKAWASVMASFLKNAGHNGSGLAELSAKSLKRNAAFTEQRMIEETEKIYRSIK